MLLRQQKNKGFTLIELLVVVAIIGLLSSVVLASLNSARGKAKDAAIKEGMHQMAQLMALNYSDYGSYCNLQPMVWVTASGVTCSSANFSGIYASQAKAICTNIYNNAVDLIDGSGGYRMLIYTDPSTCSDTYSITAGLNNGKWYCSGSSGRKGEYATYYTNPGCYNDP